MSLQVWLPLNGNLNNLGLSHIQPTNNGATINTNGKIGKCYNVNNSMGIIVNNSITLGTTFSITCWIKINSYNQDWANAFKIYKDGYDYIGLCMNQANATTKQLGFHIYKNNGSNARTGVTDNYYIPLTVGKWYHLCFIVTSTQVITYQDGIKIKTNNITTNFPSIINYNLSLGKSSLFSGLDCSINDFRLYDHALSAKEVEEIAKGLVLHYKLDNNGLGNPNLVKGNYSAITTATTNNVSGTLSFDTSIMSLNDLKGKTLYFSYDYSVEGTKLYNNTGDHTKDRYGIHGILSYVDSSGTTKTTYPFAGYLTASGTGRAIQSYIVPANAQQINSLTFGLQPFNRPAANSTATWYIKNCKLEIGQSTSYTPNQNDIHQNPSMIYDSSGYGNDGTIVGSLETIIPGPRYSCATKMTNGQYIRVNNRPATCMPKDAITVNLWQYATSWSNPISCTEGGGWNFENSSGIRFIVYISGVGYKVAQSSITPASTQNAWHMLTGTMDKNNVKIYYDGEEVGTVTNGSTNGIGYANNYIFIGAEAQGDNTSPANSSYAGNLSDVRIYATALTANQIKELYTTAATIDKNGNIYARELVE